MHTIFIAPPAPPSSLTQTFCLFPPTPPLSLPALQEDPAEAAHHRMMKEDLNHVLLTLTERECGIIKMRYGLDDGEEKTLEEVGRAFNVRRGAGG